MDSLVELLLHLFLKLVREEVVGQDDLELLVTLVHELVQGLLGVIPQFVHREVDHLHLHVLHDGVTPVVVLTHRVQLRHLLHLSLVLALGIAGYDGVSLLFFGAVGLQFFFREGELADVLEQGG